MQPTPYREAYLLLRDLLCPAGGRRCFSRFAINTLS